MAKLHVGDKMPFFTFQTESQSGLTTESVLRNGSRFFGYCATLVAPLAAMISTKLLLIMRSFKKEACRFMS